MQTENTEEMSAPKPIDSIWVLGARLTWISLGPLLLIIATTAIVSQGQGWTTFVDGVFAVAVGLMILGRWVEMRSGSATTADGQPAHWGHFRRYVQVLLPFALSVWVVANIVGNHVLTHEVSS